MLKNSVITSLFVLLFLTSCDKNGVFEENINTKDKTWSMADIARFGVTINDTISHNNIYINIRNTTDYPNSNLYLFITTTAPTGATQADTIECILSDDFGKWLGKGFGYMRDNRFLYKQNVRFPVKGNYKFEIQQAMRTDDLKGIATVGLRIEKKF